MSEDVSWAGVEMGVIPDDVRAVMTADDAAVNFMLSGENLLVGNFRERRANVFIQELFQRGYRVEKVRPLPLAVEKAMAIEDEVGEIA